MQNVTHFPGTQSARPKVHLNLTPFASTYSSTAQRSPGPRTPDQRIRPIGWISFLSIPRSKYPFGELSARELEQDRRRQFSNIPDAMGDAGLIPRMNLRTAVSRKVGKIMGLVGPMYIYLSLIRALSWYLDA